MPKPTQIPVHITGFEKPVYFPATMQPEEIQRAIEEDVLPELQRMQSAPQPTSEPLTRGERYKRGLTDVFEGLDQKFLQINDALNNRARRRSIENPTPAITPVSEPYDTAGPMTEKANEGRAEYDARRGKDAGIDWMRVGGGATAMAPAAFIPGGQGALARTGIGALTGGGLGAMQFDPSNSAKGAAINTAVGAGTGAVIAPVAGYVGDKLGSAISSLSGRVSGWLAERAGKTAPNVIEEAIPEAATLPPAQKQALFDEAIGMVRRTGQLNVEALRRKANLVANEVTPLKSMVTRDPMDWTLERNLQKMGTSPNDRLREIGGELTAVYQGNDKALANQFTKMQAQLPKGTQEQLGERAMRGVSDVASKSQEAVRAGYDQVDNQVGNELASDARNVFGVITDPKYMFNPRSKPLVEATRDYLKHMGMIDSKGALTTNTLTAAQNEQLRQFVNTLDDTFGRNAIIKAIDADAVSGLGQDAYGAARQAAKTRFSTLDNASTQRALNTFGELQQGKTAQNFIQQQIIGGADQDVAALLKTLAPDQEAVDSIRAGVVQHLESVAVDPVSGQFKGSALAKAVDNFGPKLDLIFGKEGAAQIRSLAQAGVDATFQPPYSAVNHSNSGALIMGSMADKLKSAGRYVRAVPLVKDAIEGGSEVAAENSAQRVLSDALSARAKSPMQVNPYARRLADALNAAAVPGSVVGLNTLRNNPKKGANDEHRGNR